MNQHFKGVSMCRLTRCIRYLPVLGLVFFSGCGEDRDPEEEARIQAERERTLAIFNDAKGKLYEVIRFDTTMAELEEVTTNCIPANFAYKYEGGWTAIDMALATCTNVDVVKFFVGMAPVVAQLEAEAMARDSSSAAANDWIFDCQMNDFNRSLAADNVSCEPVNEYVEAGKALWQLGQTVMRAKKIWWDSRPSQIKARASELLSEKISKYAFLGAAYSPSPEVLDYVASIGGTFELAQQGKLKRWWEHAKALVSSSNVAGVTPFLAAAWFNPNDGVLDWFLKSNPRSLADVTREEIEGACGLLSFKETDSDILAYLIPDKERLKATSLPKGTTALSGAVLFGRNARRIVYLIQHGFPVDQTDECGKTALMHACERGRNGQVIKALLLSGANLTGRKDSDENTALDYLSDNDELLQGKSAERYINDLMGRKLLREPIAMWVWILIVALGFCLVVVIVGIAQSNKNS